MLYPERPGGEQRYITSNGSNLFTYNIPVNAQDDSQVGRFFSFDSPTVQGVFLTSAGYRQSNVILDHSKLDLNTGGRGYMMDARDWRDVEYTTYVKVASSEDNEFTLSVRGGQHDNARACEYASYKAAFHYTRGIFRIRKERYLDGFANAGDTITTAGPLDHWVGVKFVVVNRLIGGKHCVLLEVWIDANATNSWIKRGSWLDDGNDLCVTGTSCSGESCQIINWGGPMAIYEIRSTGVSIAKCSIREINYDGSFGSTPPPPPPTGQPPALPPSPEPDNPSGKFNIPGGNVTASGNDGNVPANTVDNRTDTRWAASPLPSWITYDLGTIRRVSSVGVHWYRPFIPDPPSPPPPSPPPGSPPPSPPSPPGSLIENGVRMFYPRVGAVKTFVFSSSTAGRSQYVATLDHCFVNSETTAYLNISDVENMGEEVSIKVRGGCHGCNDDDCGKCYIMGVGYDGSVNAQYEEPHPSNHPYGIHEDSGNFSTGGDMIGRWFGIKAICYKNPGANSDHLEVWLDTDGLNAFGQPMNSWRKFWELNVTEFTGICPAPSNCDRRFLTFFRMDEVSGNEEDAVDLRFATCREITV